MGSRLGARRALVSLVVFGALAGCGDDSAVEVTATPVPTVSSATPEPSPTPTAPATAVPLPVMPPEMANNDAAGAEAAVRYALDLYGYTYLSQDLEPWRQFSDDDCVFCQSVISGVEALSAEGNVQSGGLLHVESLELVEQSVESEAYAFAGVVTQEQFEVRSADGKIVDSGDEETIDGSFVLSRSTGSWKLIAAGSSSEGGTS